MLAADLSPIGDCHLADAGYVQHAKSDFGDANCDGVFDSADLVQIMQAGEYEDNIDKKNRVKNENNSQWQEGDFDGDGDFTSHDLVLALQHNDYEGGSNHTTSRSPWDVNGDGTFNSTDLVQVMTAGKYEDNEAIFAEDGEYKGTRNVRNTDASEGDWNGDLEFTSDDLVVAMQTDDYVS